MKNQINKLILCAFASISCNFVLAMAPAEQPPSYSDVVSQDGSAKAERLACLLRQNNGNAQDALWAVIKSGKDADCINLLISSGAKTEIPDSRGLEPLIIASVCENKDAVEELLKAGATEKDAALYFAQVYEHHAIEDILKAHGAQITAETEKAQLKKLEPLMLEYAHNALGQAMVERSLERCFIQ